MVGVIWRVHGASRDVSRAPCSRWPREWVRRSMTIETETVCERWHHRWKRVECVCAGPCVFMRVGGWAGGRAAHRPCGSVCRFGPGVPRKFCTSCRENGIPQHMLSDLRHSESAVSKIAEGTVQRSDAAKTARLTPGCSTCSSGRRFALKVDAAGDACLDRSLVAAIGRLLRLVWMECTRDES